MIQHSSNLLNKILMMYLGDTKEDSNCFNQIKQVKMGLSRSKMLTIYLEKKKKYTFFIMFILLVSNSANSQSEFKTKKYGGVGYIYNKLRLVDIETFHISDWEKYGLRKIDPNSNEGRVEIPLGDNKNYKNTNGLLIFGGFQHRNLFYGAEIGFSGRYKMYCPQFGFHLGVNLIQANDFDFGLYCKYLWYGGRSKYDNIQLIDDYIEPVIIEQGKFTNGDTVTFKYSARAFQVGLTCWRKLSKGLYLNIQIGHNFSSNGRGRLEIESANLSEDFTLNMNDKAIVKPDGFNEQAKLNPRILLSGLTFTIALGGKGILYK